MKDRGKDWNKQQKKAVLRDGVCQICRKKNKLHVHHIIPYRNSKNNNLDNLIVLCSSCHKIEENKYLRYGKPSPNIRIIMKKKYPLPIRVISIPKEEKK